MGDVILKYRGKAVADTRELRNGVAATAPGTSVEALRGILDKSGERVLLLIHRENASLFVVVQLK
jgi:S1-C subfamily serine protease